MRFWPTLWFIGCCAGTTWAISGRLPTGPIGVAAFGYWLLCAIAADHVIARLRRLRSSR